MGSRLSEPGCLVVPGCIFYGSLKHAEKKWVYLLNKPHIGI